MHGIRTQATLPTNGDVRAPPAFPTSGPILEGTGEAPQAASVLDRLSSYMTPFRDQVLAAAMDDYDADAGRRRAAQDLELAGQGAFGGSGAALTRSLTEGELARGRNSRLAGLLDQMFTQGAGLASGDADRRQQASTAAAQLAQARDLQRAQLVQARDLEQARLGQEWGLETSRLGQARRLLRAGDIAGEGGAFSSVGMACAFLEHVQGLDPDERERERGQF